MPKKKNKKKKTTNQPTNQPTKTGQRKTAEVFFIFILRAILQIEDIEKEWEKFGKNLLDLIQVKDLLTNKRLVTWP